MIADRAHINKAKKKPIGLKIELSDKKQSIKNMGKK